MKRRTTTTTLVVRRRRRMNYSYRTHSKQTMISRWTDRCQHCSFSSMIRTSKGQQPQGGTLEQCDEYHPVSLSYMWLNILLKQPTEKLSIAFTTILAHQEVWPSALGGVPPFQQNAFLTGNLMDKFHHGHWACRANTPPLSDEMKSHFTFYHVPLMQPEACTKPTTPAYGLMHAPVVAMLSHLIWFLESAVDEDQDEQCHYSPIASHLHKGS
jgi:hypothetical protein